MIHGDASESIVIKVCFLIHHIILNNISSTLYNQGFKCSFINMLYLDNQHTGFMYEFIING